MKDQHSSYGEWTEGAVTRATALGGQADFTFAAHDVSKGKAIREIGDTVVWRGHRVLVISTKSRDLGPGMDDDLARASGWLDKAIAKGSSQIDGVVRTLRTASPGTIRLRSERGVQIPWDGIGVRDYAGLIVINYKAPPNYVPRRAPRPRRSQWTPESGNSYLRRYRPPLAFLTTSECGMTSILSSRSGRRRRFWDS